MQPEEEAIETANSYRYYYQTGGISEIEEEDSSGVFDNRRSVVTDSIIEESNVASNRDGIGEGSEDCVYVVIEKSEASVDALAWTLKNVVKNHESTLVYLVHVFPETHHIPYPRMIPKSQASLEQIKNYMEQKSNKRREFLRKFIDMCSTAKVKVETILIESDMFAKAILDLIPILNMKMLILGATKSDLRKLKSKRGSVAVDQILQTAPEFCEVKIIIDGNLVQNLLTESPPPRSDNGVTAKSVKLQSQSNNNDSFSCMCFKAPKVM